MEDQNEANVLPLLDTIARIAGLEKANECIWKLGGTSISLSAKPRETHRLRHILGGECYDRVFLAMGGTALTVIIPTNIIQIRGDFARHLHGAGMSTGQIARLFNVSPRHAEKMCSGVLVDEAAMTGVRRQDHIREFVRKKGFSIRKAAAETGIHPSTVCKILAKDRV